MPPTIPSRGGPSGLKFRHAAVGGKTVLSAKPMGAQRHRKITKDHIRGITKPTIRRLARRGGVKRISAGVYDTIRLALKERLTMVIRDVVAFTEHRNTKTVTVNDVIFALRRLGSPIYGFDPETFHSGKKKLGGGLGKPLEDDD
ncbi:histone-fold-containing protein [Lasiosphaeria miniovina]|uniref:Histone H4 n=1 Tax=Lasiosphaeria miniovina TaxID=1954250 RepID=A0AA40DY95_9PEZI|nr:histone-fold-containing protein [Lasiosphaeria miniovina]KAK0718087.1 histone-fold-containing protein [Lasiosphaeria miniovina]